MRIIKFGPEVGREIKAFGSEGLVISPVLRAKGAAQVGCMHIAPGGHVGRHEATEPQVFMVISGSGWVEGADGRRVSIETGWAACWATGELHSSGTATGMSALVVEVDEVTLMRMPERISD